jgi:hypothetical protein
VKTPKLASIVQIIGSVDVDHSNYQVEVTPTPPSGQGKYEFSAFNPWTTPNQVLFSTQLDPSVEYTIRYTHLNESAQIYSDLSSFHFVLAEATK